MRSKNPVISIFSLLLCFAVFQSSFIFATDNDPGTSVGKFKSWSVVGPQGGDVRVITIDPKNKDRVYASTLDGQIHVSIDGGRSWRLLTNLDRAGLIIDNLIVDSRDSNLIFATGHRGTSAGGFFRSKDGGQTWKEASELKRESIHALTQSDAEPDHLYVGTTTGVWRSKDSGSKWERIMSLNALGNSPTKGIDDGIVASGVPYVNSFALDPRNTGLMYAGTTHRPYKSTDNGKSWRLIKNGMIDDSDIFTLRVNPRNPDHVIASACSGIYQSFNSGERWTKFQGIPSTSRRTRDIIQHPSNPNTLYAGTTEGFWMSINGGKSWALTTQRNLEINSIAIHPDEPNRVLIGTNNYGVMISNDGGKSFAQSNIGYSSRLTYFVVPDTEQPNRLYAATHNTATGGGYFFLSSDGGQTWQQPRNFDVARLRPFSIKQDPVNANKLYMGTNLGIYHSADRGLSWAVLAGKAPPKAPVKRPVRRNTRQPVRKTAAVTAKPPSATTSTVLIPTLKDVVKTIEVIPDGSGVMLVGTDKGLYRSTDVTKGWEKLSFGPGINENVFAIHISPKRPDVIWAGTATSGVVVSRDKGKTWQKTNGAVDNIPVSSITSDPERPDYIYVGTIQTFYLSRDDGKSWKRRGGNLSLGNFTSILINPNNTDEIILASALDTEGGIYISSDAGDRWQRVDKKEDMKLPSHRFWSLVFDPHDPNRMFAATHSSGVYRIERSTVIADN